jgi:hypothetical protein
VYFSRNARAWLIPGINDTKKKAIPRYRIIAAAGTTIMLLNRKKHRELMKV